MNFKESSIMAVPEVSTTTAPKVNNPVYDAAPDNNPAKVTVDKIFTIFDPKGTGKITDKELYKVDKQDGNVAGPIKSTHDKTLSVFDLKKAAHPDAKIDPDDANKVLSQDDFAKLLGANNTQEMRISITKDDAIKHFAANKKDLTTIQDFLAGKVKAEKPEKRKSDKPAKNTDDTPQPFFDPKTPTEYR